MTTVSKEKSGFLNKITFRGYSAFLVFLTIVLAIFQIKKDAINNYLIFKYSFTHLLQNLNLYVHYPEQYVDLYKYSPPFALLMAPFAALPDWFGVICWALLNLLVLLWAVKESPFTDKAKVIALLILTPELIGSTQNMQANILIAGLALWTWIALERGRVWIPLLLIAASFYIKVFGIILLTLFLFRKYSRGRWFEIIWQSVVVFAGIAIFPAVVIGPDALLGQYRNWLELLRMDEAASYGYSLMGILSGFGLPVQNKFFQFTAGLLTVLAFLSARNGKSEARWIGFISLMYFFVLFNHKSESPTFIIPVLALAIDYNRWNIEKVQKRWALFACLFFISLLSAGLLPGPIKKEYFHPLAMKVWPFAILWPLAIWSLRPNSPNLKTDLQTSTR